MSHGCKPYFFHHHFFYFLFTMKTKLISTLVLTAAATTSQFAAAADGVITFTGNVTAQTCTINGSAAARNFTVALPKVSKASLGANGATAGRTPFAITLSACDPATGTVHAFFEAGPTVDAASGRLNLVGGGAGNVQIELLNSDMSPIKAGFADASQNSKAVTLATGAGTLSYYAQYVATGVATAGAANSNVTYTIAYQ